MVDPAQAATLAAREWDAVIVGAGMGGATLGHALAKAGWRVLWCDKGRSLAADALRGRYAETFLDSSAPDAQQQAVLQRAGRWTDDVEERSGTKPRRFVPFVGAGAGGSSALYGMALERFLPDDFTPAQRHPHARDANLPARWPIAYADLAPHYAKAEQLFRVRGGVDALRQGDAQHSMQPGPPLSPAAQEMFDFFARQGLHPYRLPLACDFVSGCEGCQGYLCAKQCKNDSARVCLEPALGNHDAALLERCEVQRLTADARRVTGVVCHWQGTTLRLRARIVVLASGALASPTLLLRSASPEWPKGLANESGLVGRNLMRHFVDLYAVFPKGRHAIGGNTKELAWSDLYAGDALGSFQSFGSMPPPEVLVASMQQDLRDALGTLAGAAFAPVKPVLRRLLRRMFSRSLVFATILEDLPYADNRVFLADESADKACIAMSYRIHATDAQRIAALRRRARTLLRPYRFLQFRQAENNRRLAHACGTLRFGVDPRDSVLDPTNKAHGIDNLYVVDASFFPTSGGTNPALTIAANALRVADHLVAAA